MYVRYATPLRALRSLRLCCVQLSYCTDDRMIDVDQYQIRIAGISHPANRIACTLPSAAASLASKESAGSGKVVGLGAVAFVVNVGAPERHLGHVLRAQIVDEGLQPRLRPVVIPLGRARRAVRNEHGPNTR